MHGAVNVVTQNMYRHFRLNLPKKLSGVFHQNRSTPIFICSLMDKNIIAILKDAPITVLLQQKW